MAIYACFSVIFGVFFTAPIKYNVALPPAKRGFSARRTPDKRTQSRARPGRARLIPERRPCPSRARLPPSVPLLSRRKKGTHTGAFARRTASRRNRKAARTVRTAFFEYIFRIPLQSGMPTRTAARTPHTRRRASARHKCRLRKKPGLQPQPAFTGRGCCRRAFCARWKARAERWPGTKSPPRCRTRSPRKQDQTRGLTRRSCP